MPPPPRQLAPAARRRQRLDRAALVLLALGAVFRIHLAATLPVGYDEVFVMGLGLDAMQTSTEAALLDVPVTRSTAVTPLWWWVQYAPVIALGDLSLIGMRVIPAGLGVATMVLAWLCARARFGRGTALAFLAFVSLSDILIFTNSRGEFAESLTAPLIILLACRAGCRGHVIRRGLIGALLLLTALVKGVLVVGMVLLAEGLCSLLSSGNRRRRVLGLALSLLIAAVPVPAYLIWANAHLGDGPIHHDAMEASSLGALIKGLMFDYTTVKAHVTGTLRDAVFVLLDFDVWPTTVLAAPLAVAGLVVGLIRLARRRFSTNGRRAAARTVLVTWVALGAAVVVGRGTLGARFHLLYLPAAWLLASLWLAGRRPAGQRWGAFAICAGWSAWVGFAASWVDWENLIWDLRVALAAAVGLFAGSVMLVSLLRKRMTMRTSATMVWVAAAGLALCVWGPNLWGSFARFEPMPRGVELAAIDAIRSGREPPVLQTGRTLYIDLANYFLGGAPDKPENRSRALHYARLEVKRDPNDARAWAYVGEALLRSRGSLTEARRAFQRSYELAPSERVAQRLAQWEQATDDEQQP